MSRTKHPTSAPKTVTGATGGRELTNSLEKLSNVSNAVASTGSSLVYSGTEWKASFPDTLIHNWVATTRYRPGEVVFFAGQLYRAKLFSINHPTSETAYWERITNIIQVWKKDTAYKRGDVVRVPWNTVFFQAFDTNLLANPVDHYSLWVATVDIPGDTPVSAGEPASASSVPPGQFINTNHGVHENPLAHVGYHAWTAISSPATIVVRDLQEILDMTNPVVPGSTALVMTGAAAGHLYRYTANPSDPGTDAISATARGWENLGAVSGIGGSDMSKIDMGYDPNKGYDPGALISFNGKVYVSQLDTSVPIVDYHDGDNVPFTEWDTSFGHTGTIEQFLAANQRGTYFFNRGTTPVTVPSGPLVGKTVPPAGVIATLGMKPTAPSFDLSGEIWTGGQNIYGTGYSAITLNVAAANALNAEQAENQKILPGDSPAVSPGNWQLVGEPNQSLSGYATTASVTAAVAAEATRVNTQFTTEQTRVNGRLTTLDSNVSTLTTGIAHGASVEDIANAPTVTTDGTLYIVGTAPTGDFATHANALAFRQSGAWVFTAPATNEAHLNESDNTIYHWNGTAWNKIGSTGATTLVALTDTTIANPANGQVLTYNGTAWTAATPAAPPAANEVKAVNVKPQASIAEIDLGTASWTSIKLNTNVEMHSSDEHLCLAFRHASGGALQTTQSHFNYGSFRLVYNNASVNDLRESQFFFGSNKINLTWLQTDRNAVLYGSNAQLELSLNKTSYGEVAMAWTITWHAKNLIAPVCFGQLILNTGSTASSSRYLAITDHSGASVVGLTGQLTVT